MQLIKRVSLVLLLVALSVSANTALAQQSNNVLMCHVPGGNPAAAFEIIVGVSSVDSHLEAGDRLGSCLQLVDNPGDEPLPPSSTDGIKNGDETDVDCGGLIAPKCQLGRHCSLNLDCASGLCADGVCAANVIQEPGPSDGNANGDEPLAPTSTDGIKNGDETDVDCGGQIAPKCQLGQHCALDLDCASAFCADGVCAVRVVQQPSSTDGIKNGDETDVDCGGLTAPQCGVGQHCSIDTDCENFLCQLGYCTNAIVPAPRNDDGIWNGDETDIDCGGSSAPKCELGKKCAAASDCLSNRCEAEICVSQPVGSTVIPPVTPAVTPVSNGPGGIAASGCACDQSNTQASQSLINMLFLALGYLLFTRRIMRSKQ